MDEQEILAVVRTLMAYERNYLSIERTQLAQLRTGLTLALIIPPAAATLQFAFDFFPKNDYIGSVVYIFLGILILYGIWMASHAYFGLKETRKIQNKIKGQELEFMRKSSVFNTILEEIVVKNKK